jgi:hypothetical protein
VSDGRASCSGGPSRNAVVDPRSSDATTITGVIATTPGFVIHEEGPLRKTCGWAVTTNRCSTWRVIEVDAVVIDLATHANRGPHPDRSDGSVPAHEYVARAVVQRSTDPADEVAERPSALIASAVIVAGSVSVYTLAAPHDPLPQSVRRTPVAHERFAVLDDVVAGAGADDPDHDAEDTFVDWRVDPRASPIRRSGGKSVVVFRVFS